MSNQYDNELKSFSTNNQTQIVGTISNLNNFNQQFVYLFQINDVNDAFVSLSWVKCVIPSNQSNGVSQFLFPFKSGVHFVETFVCSF